MIWQHLLRADESEKQPSGIWIAYHPSDGQPTLLVDEGQPEIREDDLMIHCVEATDEEIDATIEMCDLGRGARRMKPAFDWSGDPV